MIPAGAMVQRGFQAGKLFSLVESRFLPRRALFCRGHASRASSMHARCALCAHAARDAMRPRAGGMLVPMKLIVRWLLLAAALLLVAHLYAGVQVASFGAAMIAALVLGLLNTLVRPLLVLLTLPVTLLTLGLFLFVINALMFWAAASLLAGFNVA